MKTDRFTATAVALISVCVGALAPICASADETYYTITIKCGPDDNCLLRLKTFYQRLLAELKVSDLGYANVGCDNCAKFDQVDPPIVSLKFVMEPDSTTLAAFALSYHYLQTNLHEELFTMAINGVTATGACPENAVALGCRPRPICVQTNSCDKPYGGSCALCQ